MSLFKKEFPNYDGEFYLPKNWDDVSYHNDICPHARLLSTDERIELNLWQDYINTNLREYEDNKRYTFQIIIDNNIVFSFESDCLAEIKKMIDSVNI